MLPRRDRIRNKIIERVRITPNDDNGFCWVWTGPTSGKKGRGKGYGRFCLDGGTMAVHRVMFMVENGPIPPRKQIDHKCRNRLCCNPDHLEMTTHKTNQKRRDKAIRG